MSPNKNDAPKLKKIHLKKTSDLGVADDMCKLKNIFIVRKNSLH